MTDTLKSIEPVNQKAIDAMAQFLEALGLDLKKLNMEKTPYRVAAAFGQFFSGLQENPDGEWTDPIITHTDGLVAVRNIRFQSMCEHHLLPFFGTVHIAYYPKNGKISGFGHFVNMVDILSRRPQLQERITEEICQSIVHGIAPQGVLVIVKATHLCLTMRSRLAVDTNIVTAASNGCLCRGSEPYNQAWKMLMEETLYGK